MLKEINHKILHYGRGLLAKIKYGISFSYNRYNYMSAREEKYDYYEHKVYKSITQKIKY